MRSESFSKKWHGFSQTGQLPLRNDFLETFVEMSLKNVEASVPIKIRKMDRERMTSKLFILCIPPPIGRRQIHPAVPVEIGCNHPIPPALVSLHLPGLGDLRKLSPLIREETNDAPFTRQHKIKITISIEIRENSRTY